jgi:hypothetical protein
LDIANRTMLATADLAGVDLDLKWDDKGECDSALLISCCCWQVLTLHCSPSLFSFIQPESFQLQYQTQGLKMQMT